MSARKVGGIWFIRVGAWRFQVTRVRVQPKLVQYRRPAFPETF